MLRQLHRAPDAVLGTNYVNVPRPTPVGDIIRSSLLYVPYQLFLPHLTGNNGIASCIYCKKGAAISHGAQLEPVCVETATITEGLFRRRRGTTVVY